MSSGKSKKSFQNIEEKDKNSMKPKSSTDSLPWKLLDVSMSTDSLEAGLGIVEQIPAGSYELVEGPGGGKIIKMKSSSKNDSNSDTQKKSSSKRKEGEHIEKGLEAKKTNETHAKITEAKKKKVEAVEQSSEEIDSEWENEAEGDDIDLPVDSNDENDGWVVLGENENIDFVSDADFDENDDEENSLPEDTFENIYDSGNNNVDQPPKKKKKTKEVKSHSEAFAPVKKHLSLDLIRPEWEPLGVQNAQILHNIATLGYLRPTKVQSQAIPAALIQYKDVIGSSETGSGKTMAFSIPIVCRLLERREKLGMNTTYQSATDSSRGSPQSRHCVFSSLPALIITPTRELAVQISSHISSLATGTAVRVGTIVGGLAPEKQQRIIRSHPDIIVATPGRLWDIMKSGKEPFLDLVHLQFLVLDESDRLMEKNSFSSLTTILDRLTEAGKKRAEASEFLDPQAEEIIHQLKKRGNLVDVEHDEDEKGTSDKEDNDDEDDEEYQVEEDEEMDSDSNSPEDVVNDAEMKIEISDNSSDPRSVSVRGYLDMLLTDDEGNSGQSSASEGMNEDVDESDDDETIKSGDLDEMVFEYVASTPTVHPSALPPSVRKPYLPQYIDEIAVPSHYKRQTLLFSATLGLSTSQNVRDAAKALVHARLATDAANGVTKVSKKQLRRAEKEAAGLSPLELLMSRVGVLGKTFVVRMDTSQDSMDLPDNFDQLIKEKTEGEEDTSEIQKGIQGREENASGISLPEHLKIARITVPSEQEKELYLYTFLTQFQGRSIVFSNSLSSLRRIYYVLSTLRIPCAQLHAKMPQKSRLAALENFRNSSNSVLIASDVAARGIDIPNVDFVVQTAPALTAETFVHRCGRTGRGGSSGLAVTLVGPRDQQAYMKSMKVLGFQAGLPEFPLDSRMLKRLVHAVSVAKRLVALQDQQNEMSNAENWLKKTSNSAEIEVDEYSRATLGSGTHYLSGSEHVKVSVERQNQLQTREIQKLRSELAIFLNETVVPGAVGKKRFLASNPAFTGEEHPLQKMIGSAVASATLDAKQRETVTSGSALVAAPIILPFANPSNNRGRTGIIAAGSQTDALRHLQKKGKLIHVPMNKGKRVRN